MKRKAIFMDRDGVLNEEVSYISRPADLHVLPGVARAVRSINDSGWLAIVVTNQSAVARGICSVSGLEEIHTTLQAALWAESGGRLDAIYYCPHHPNTGNPKPDHVFEIDCGCRKPKTGMIERAAKDFDLDLQGSYMVGDTPADVLCGKNAGLHTIVVRTGKPYPAEAEKPDLVCDDLAAAVALILSGAG